MTLLLTLAPVWLAYLLGIASPGPSNMAIMGVAMRQGPGLAMAAGVITGSLFWAGVVASGLSTLLLAWSQALVAIKIFGGVWLLWLACKALRSATSKKAVEAARSLAVEDVPLGAHYRRGVLLHLTNPKAILVWLAIMALAVRPDAPAIMLPLLIAGCALLGTLVFGCYALIFSTATMSRIYIKTRRITETLFALFFGAAGLKLLLK